MNTRPVHLALLSCLLGFAGCGSGGSGGPDAPAGPDASVDAPPAVCGARTTTSDTKLASLLDWLEQEMRDAHVPGAAIAVVDGGTIQVGLMGVQQAGGCDAITRSTRFRLGPASRPFTAAALLSAAEDWKVNLEAPITDAVGYFAVSSGDASAVTLDDLMTERSGWPNFFETTCAGASLSDWFKAHTDVALWFPPGSMYSWSVYGYSLAGLALEEASGEPFAQVMAERVFQPLSAGATYDLTTFLAGDHADGHRGTNDQVVTQTTCPVWEPTTGLFASVDDVGSFMAAILGGGSPILSSVASMTSARGPDFPPAWHTTFGFREVPYHGVETFWANGKDSGFSAEIVLVPSESFGFAILTNHQGAPVDDISQKALEILQGLPAYAWDDNTTDPSTWSAYAGTYVDPIGVGSGARTMTIAFDGSKLTADLGGVTSDLMASYPHVEQGADVFTLSYLGQPVTIRFWRDGNGQPWAIGSAAGELGPPAFRQ